MAYVLYDIFLPSRRALGVLPAQRTAPHAAAGARASRRGSSPAHATWLMLCHAQHSLSPCKWLHVACIQVERRDAIARG